MDTLYKWRELQEDKEYWDKTLRQNSKNKSMSNKNKIIRKFPNGKEYELTYQAVKIEFDKKVKHSRWMSINKDSNGLYATKDYVCTIPPGEEDIDITTLDMQCFLEK